MIDCKICEKPSNLFYKQDRNFYKCPDCSFIFSECQLEREEENIHYKDQWGTSDPSGWKNKADVLMKLASNYNHANSILDFGSGSGELTQELQERGLNVTPLEPMIHGYLKEQKYNHKFDVVIGYEVIEHIPNLFQELGEIEKVLTQDGIMVFSTLLTNPFINTPAEIENFKAWWYKDDPTHVNFFCNNSLSKMADKRNYNIDIYANMFFVIQLNN